MFSCKRNLQILAPLMGFTLTGHSNQHRRFSTKCLQFIDSLCATSFFLPANKQQTSYEDLLRHTASQAAKLCVNVFLTIVYAEFETAIHNIVTTVWPGREVKACRFHVRQSWWGKMQSLGLSKQYGKKDSEVRQFLKKIFGLLILPPVEVSDSFVLDFISNLRNDKRVGQFCDYLLENYNHVDSTFPRLFGPNVLHHLREP